MNARTATTQKLARVTIERLNEMVADSEAILDSQPLEQGVAEIMRQNNQALRDAATLILEAYTLPIARAH